MKFIVTTLLVSVSYFIIGQNLVPNPGFEDTLGCPYTYAHLGYTSEWFNPTASSPDYFHECAGVSNAGIPQNFVGYQQANSGKAYAGIVTFNVSTPSFYQRREYISIQLLESLVHGKDYIVEFYVSRADDILYASKIGARFSNTAINENTYSVLNFDPHVEQTTPVTNKIQWELLSFNHTANGDEQYLTIGNFRTDSLSDTLNTNDVELSTSAQLAYYYIDDVAVY